VLRAEDPPRPAGGTAGPGKYTPEVRKPDDIDPAYHFNRSLIEKAMGTQEYE